MSKEMKIGAGLGLVLVLISSWFFVSRSNDEQAVPLTGETVTADGAKAGDPAKKPEDKSPASAAKPQADRRDNGARGANSGTPARPGARPAGAADDSAARTASTTGTAPEPNANRLPARRPPVSPAETSSPSAQPPSRSDVVSLNPASPAREEAAGPSSPARTGGEAGTAPATTPPAPATGNAVGGMGSDAAARSAQGAERSNSTPGISPGIYPPRPGTNTPAASPGTTPAQPAGGTARPADGGAQAAKPAANPAASGPVREHVVKSGDTFAGLAEQYYGSQRHMGYLIAANKQIKDPGRLSIGQKLTIPPAPQGTEAKTASAGRPITPTGDGRTYVVQAGDSFYDIAAKALGAGARWPEIYERNKDVVGNNPANLTVGQVLELPPRE